MVHMNHLTKIAAAITCILTLTGCATRVQDETLSFTNTNLLRIEDSAPRGYPRTYMISEGTFCARVTESWRRSKYQSQAIWLKDEHTVSVPCH